MVGFIQRSSDPSQPGRAVDKKKIQNLFYVFIIIIITKFGENFEEKIKVFGFLDELDHSDHLSIFRGEDPSRTRKGHRYIY